MIHSDVHAALAVLLYMALSAGGIFLVDLLAKVNREVIRKSYHIMITLTFFFLVTWFQVWYHAIITVLIYLALAYTFLAVFQNIRIVQRASIARNVGEVSRQILLLALTFAVLVTVFWGVTGPQWKFLAVIGVMAWGFGDAAAALIGRTFGRIRLRWRIFDQKKTIEGTLAMAAISALVVFLVLTFMSPYTVGIRLATAILLGCVGAVIEAISRNGRDTISVPLTLAGLAYPLLVVFERLEGWWR